MLARNLRIEADLVDHPFNFGFIEYNGELKINTSLLNVVLHD